MTLEWTLGENFIETITRSNSIFTQGFHQPSAKEQSGIQEDANLASLFNIGVSPNPVRSIINIKIQGTYKTPLNVSLFDISGRYIKAFPPIVGTDKVSYNMVDLASGIYILKIKSTDGAYTKTSKITKY